MDNNTKFFHRVANGNRVRKFINKLELDDGPIIEDENVIKREITSFFARWLREVLDLW